MALTLAMNLIAGLLVARLYRYGVDIAADIATTLVSRGEFALILAAMATGAGLDDRLTPFIAGYVLVLAVLGPVLAKQSPLLARALRAVQARLPDRGSSRDTGTDPDTGPSSGTGLPRIWTRGPTEAWTPGPCPTGSPPTPSASRTAAGIGPTENGCTGNACTGNAYTGNACQQHGN